jgi:hypothetical protein
MTVESSVLGGRLTENCCCRCSDQAVNHVLCDSPRQAATPNEPCCYLGHIVGDYGPYLIAQCSRYSAHCFIFQTSSPCETRVCINTHPRCCLRSFSVGYKHLVPCGKDFQLSSCLNCLLLLALRVRDIQSNKIPIWADTRYARYWNGRSHTSSLHSRLDKLDSACSAEVLVARKQAITRKGICAMF